jgi:hypothetical protein
MTHLQSQQYLHRLPLPFAATLCLIFSFAVQPIALLPLLCPHKPSTRQQEEDPTNSTNLSGGHHDIEVELAHPPSSTKKKKSNSKKDPPSADANTHKVVEYYRYNATQESPMPCDEELLIRITQELRDFATNPCHVSRVRRGETQTKCNCLRALLFDGQTNRFRSSIAMAVANYTLSHLKQDKLLQDQCFIDLYSMSQHIPTPCETLTPSLFHSTTIILPPKKEYLLSPKPTWNCGSATASAQGLLFILQRGSAYYEQQKR